jgi:hypothetical protein
MSISGTTRIDGERQTEALNRFTLELRLRHPAVQTEWGKGFAAGT